jgi:hypothetical protein
MNKLEPNLKQPKQMYKVKLIFKFDLKQNHKLVLNEN